MYYENNGTGALIFGIICLVIAAIMFTIAAHLLALFAFGKSLENFGSKKFLKAGAWFSLCIFVAVPLLTADYRVDLFGFRGCAEQGCDGWHYVKEDNLWQLD